MATIIMLFAIVVGALAYLCYDRYKRSDIFKKVKWCVSYDEYSSFYPNYVKPELRQRGYIIHLQTEMALEAKYRITESDYDGVNEILKSYQQDLLRKYFKGYAPDYRKLSEDDYFIVTLCDFLQKNQSTDSFTDYSVTYQKLSYIAHLSSQNINKKGRY